jgi:hypothetical protein
MDLERKLGANRMRRDVGRAMANVDKFRRMQHFFEAAQACNRFLADVGHSNSEHVFVIKNARIGIYILIGKGINNNKISLRSNFWKFNSIKDAKS